MSDLAPIVWDPCRYHEENIIEHVIARARRRQPQPVYRVGDREFDRMVRRLKLSIEHDANAPYMVLEFGTTKVRVYAGGLLIEDHVIEVIEATPEVST